MHLFLVYYVLHAMHSAIAPPKENGRMPLITVKSGSSVPAGTWLAELVGITPKRMVTQYSKNGEEQDFLEWTWLVHGKDGDGEINSLTTTATGPKSRIFEYLVALLGADKVKVDAGFEESDLVGKAVMVQIVITDDGFSKIDKIMGAPSGARPTQAPVAATAAPQPAAAAAAPVEVDAGPAKDDDLPF